MKYSDTRHLLSPSTISSSSYEPSIRDEKPKKAPSIRKRLMKPLKKVGKAWYDEIEASADAGSKIGEAIARKVTGTKNTPEAEISKSKKTIIKTSKAIGEFLAAYKEVYPAVVKVPMNLLKDKDAQLDNSASEKPAKREGFFKATGRHFIENMAQGLDLGEEIGRRATGIKSGSLKNASASKELAVRMLQAAGFVAGYSVAISTALIGIPQRMLVPQNKTSDDYINPQDSEYKYTGQARRAKLDLPPSYSSTYNPSHNLSAYVQNYEPADFKDKEGLLPSDSASSIGDKPYMSSSLPSSEFDDGEIAKKRKKSEDAWEAEIARNSAHSTPTQTTVGLTYPLGMPDDFSLPAPLSSNFSPYNSPRASGMIIPPVAEPFSFRPSHVEVKDEHGRVSYVPNHHRDDENSTIISGKYDSSISEITVSSVSDNTPQTPRRFIK